MTATLLAWIGMADLRAASEDLPGELGPIAQALQARHFDAALLLTDFVTSRAEPYLAWLNARTGAAVSLSHEPLTGPTDFGEIYSAVLRACDRARGDGATALTFHLSPGTPAMAAVWILVAKTRHPAELIESSKQHGVRTASVPFDIAAELVPDARLVRLASAPPPASPEFDAIVHRSAAMARVLDRARRAAPPAMEESDGNKTRAAQLVGLPSYQTLTNWLTRYGLGD